MAKIVFITSRFPYPINKGDQLRVYFQLKSLSQNNEVHLIALHDQTLKPENYDALSFCESSNLFKIHSISRFFSLTKCMFNYMPFQVGYFYSISVRKKILTLIEQIAPDYIHAHLLRTAEYVKKIYSIEKTIDFMDAFSIGMKKRGEIEKNPFKKLLLMLEYKRLKKYESDMFNFFDRFTIISSQDANFINHQKSNEITIVPNGVDFDSFYPRNEEKKYDICFMGNMSYPPNVEAVKYMIEKIFPQLIQKKSNIKFLIAGSKPAAYIRKLQSKNIDVIQKFNHISDSIATSRVMVSPMVVSIGLQNKIIQAMAMKVPNVVSKAANKAIHSEHNVELLEAESPEEYVEAIFNLLTNQELYNKIIDKAFDFVHWRYNWKSVNSILENTIKGDIQ